MTKKLAVKKETGCAKTVPVTRVRARQLKKISLDQINPIVKKTKQARLTPEQRELVLAVYCYTDNKRETARLTGVHRNTIDKIISESFDSGESHKLRSQSREMFVDKAWECIKLATQSIKDGLIKGYVLEARDEHGNLVEMVSRISPGEAARVIRDIHHTTQLEEGRPTSIIESLADEYSDEELRKEIDKLEAQTKQRIGQLH